MTYEVIHSPDRFMDQGGSYMEREFLSLLAVFQREIYDAGSKTGLVEKEIGGVELADGVFYKCKIYVEIPESGILSIGIKFYEEGTNKVIDYFWKVCVQETVEELSMTMQVLYSGFNISGIRAVDMSEEPMDIECGIRYDKMFANLLADYYGKPLRHRVIISENQGDRKQRYLDMGYAVRDDNFNVLERIFQPK